MKYRVRLNSILVRWDMPEEEARAYAVLLADQAAQYCDNDAERAAAQTRVGHIRQGQVDDVRISIWRITLEKDINSE